MAYYQSFNTIPCKTLFHPRICHHSDFLWFKSTFLFVNLNTGKLLPYDLYLLTRYAIDCSNVKSPASPSHPPPPPFNSVPFTLDLHLLCMYPFQGDTAVQFLEMKQTVVLFRPLTPHGFVRLFPFQSTSVPAQTS